MSEKLIELKERIKELDEQKEWIKIAEVKELYRKEEFKESMIKKILESSKNVIDDKIESEECIKDCYIDDILEGDTQMHCEDYYYNKEKEEEMKEKVIQEIQLGLGDLEKYLEMYIGDYWELKKLEIKYKDKYSQANI